MGCVPTTYPCVGCGTTPAGVQLIDDQGHLSDGFYCWDCAMERSTPIPPTSPVAYVLAFLDPLWVRSRAGAAWLAQRLAAHEKREVGRSLEARRDD